MRNPPVAIVTLDVRMPGKRGPTSNLRESALIYADASLRAVSCPLWP